MVAAAGFFFGISLFRAKYFVVTDKEFNTYSLYGPSKQHFLYQNKSDISTDGKSIFILRDGKQVKLPYSKISSDPKDWKALIAWIETGAPLA